MRYIPDWIRTPSVFTFLSTRTSVGDNYARARGHAYFVGGLVFLGISVALIVSNSSDFVRFSHFKLSLLFFYVCLIEVCFPEFPQLQS